MATPNRACSSPWPMPSQIRRNTHAAGSSSTRARAHGLGGCSLVTVMNATAATSWMMRMPIATRP